MRRFWEKVEQTDGCWLWRASRLRAGYGLFTDETSALVLAHRFAYRALVGPLRDGLFVLHHCDTPACVRPDHLRLGTQAENMAEMKEKGRARNQNTAKTHCPRGHEYTPENTLLSQGRRNCRTCRRRKHDTVL
jgi:hypothetical protein